MSTAAVPPPPSDPHHPSPSPPPAQSLTLSPSLSLSTLAIHADDHLAPTPDVAPPLHVSTNFNYSNDPLQLIPAGSPHPHDAHPLPHTHIYSRESAPITTRLESILSSLLNGHAITYSSGLAALHAALVFLNPSRLSIGEGYHGSHGVVALQQKLTGLTQLPLDCPAADLNAGDVIHLETPVNPTGEAYEIAKYAEKAHSRGAYLLVDATFGPPGLQDPFRWGADVVMHSGTKYLGGHSDMLCGVLVVRREREEWCQGLLGERTYLGSVMGSLEGWLGVRSLRTLELRVRRQSGSAGRLVGWLGGLLGGDEGGGKGGKGGGNEAGGTGGKGGEEAGEGEEAGGKGGEEGREEGGGTGGGKKSAIVRGVVEKVTHASLQADDCEWLKHQMPDGYGPVFAIWMKSEELAKRLPGYLKLFHHATSLGGVESLIEWRAMSDATCSKRLLRVSVGVEAWEDLRDDLMNAFGELARYTEGVQVGEGTSKGDEK